MPKKDDISMLSFAKLESQKNLIGMLIKTGFNGIFNSDDSEDHIDLILSKLEAIEMLREELVSDNEQIRNIAKTSETSEDSIVDYFIFLSLLIENCYLIKEASKLGVDIGIPIMDEDE